MIGIHLTEIIILSPVTELRSTLNLPQIHMQLMVGSIKRDGDLIHK